VDGSTGKLIFQNSEELIGNSQIRSKADLAREADLDQSLGISRRRY
jgi:hypothetical protein